MRLRLLLGSARPSPDDYMKSLKERTISSNVVTITGTLLVAKAKGNAKKIYLEEHPDTKILHVIDSPPLSEVDLSLVNSIT